jgi:hypothetical protein
MKIKITDITEWSEDTALVAGDASHNGYDDVSSLLEEEIAKKVKSDELAKGLPFVCDASNEDEALEKYNAAYCEYDYMKASKCDWEEMK